MSTEAEAVRAELAAIVEPLRVEATKLDKLIAESEQTLAELKEARRSVTRTLAMLDPSSVPAKAPAKRGGGRTTTYGIAEETLAAIEKRLHDHAAEVNDNGGFTATSLRRDHGFADISQSTMGKALGVLHGRDLIRLDHRGRGGAHFYKVVA